VQFPHEPEGWYDIDFKRAYRNVRRLQARIVKATQEGRWNKVKALHTSADPLVQCQSAGSETRDGRITGKRTPAWTAKSGTRRRREQRHGTL